MGGGMWVPCQPGTASLASLALPAPATASIAAADAAASHILLPLAARPCCRQRAGDVDAALHSKDTSFEVQLSSK